MSKYLPISMLIMVIVLIVIAKLIKIGMLAAGCLIILLIGWMLFTRRRRQR
ncbi:hypothetical protein [Lihuaxuella thermophila]|uniref:Uncharacterized protein n=1 Tax=Lihuaxuella thermophila TaxID=1173111 RepID=A0A1H8CMZ5_9BACL|nr:hypothetical protein [Lihuaxuella thermophila]SEM96400.1 hypothetical protein SAMN05444955_10415 [Lihuaxuella thermophila]